ncbi:MAG: hypothetical protein IJO63_04760 [Bacilli bacterium]|nr:hypothetical protein [Bacilli bacterium]
MGKFFNGKVKKDRGTLIKYGVIAAGVILIILLFVLIAAGKNKKSDIVLELKETITFEVNSDWPEADVFFTKIENFDTNLISFTDFDISTVGEYTVTVTAEGQGSEDVTVNVVDTTAPVLELQDLVIPTGGSYSIQDFFLNCEDNSDKECFLEYDTTAIDQNGNPIDFSAYTADGKYVIKIIAKDETGNATEPQSVNLTIGNESSVTPLPSNCSYGDLTVNTDTHNYPIAVIVGDEINGCALNRDLWDSASVQTPVNDFYKKDYERLETQLKPVLKEEYPNGAKIVAYPHYVAVLNKDLKGLVGYAIYVKVYAADSTSDAQVDSDANLILSYYLRSDKTREYDVNKFKLDE